MRFIKIIPHADLRELLECYWVAENDDPTPAVEKIIPDGFTELIFHYGADYKTQISGVWQTQSRSLLAGQISNYFFLENTGTAGMIGIKLQPAALTQLFGLQMFEYTDKVVDLQTIENTGLMELRTMILPFEDEHILKDKLDEYFIRLKENMRINPIDKALSLIFKLNGIVSVTELTETTGVGERQLERLFKKHVGLSPKYYARIIRFNYIFKLIQSKNTTWSTVVFHSGYYDQSHFIRNFKAFTGEDPSAYFFEAQNMANFFLKK